MSIDNRERFANAYESELADHGFTEGDLVNKHLFNMRLLGLIATLFPNAKVIYTHRSAKDVAVSCMLGNFSGQVHPELQSFNGISNLLEQHKRLRAHWDQVLPLQTLDVSYEELIENPNEVTQQILNFCGLEWSDTCAEFYNSDRTVMTLSYNQVRRPMYPTSVNRAESGMPPILRDMTGMKPNQRKHHEHTLKTRPPVAQDLQQVIHADDWPP